MKTGGRERGGIDACTLLLRTARVLVGPDADRRPIRVGHSAAYAAIVSVSCAIKPFANRSVSRSPVRPSSPESARTRCGCTRPTHTRSKASTFGARASGSTKTFARYSSGRLLLEARRRRRKKAGQLSPPGPGSATPNRSGLRVLLGVLGRGVVRVAVDADLQRAPEARPDASSRLATVARATHLRRRHGSAWGYRPTANWRTRVRPLRASSLRVPVHPQEHSAG